jgi:hypothetical protein
MNKRLSLLVLALSANSAPAQEISEAPEAAEIRRYTVEMIIFAYSTDVSAGSEIFIPDEPPPEAIIDDVDAPILESLPEVVEEALPTVITDEDVRPYELVMLEEEELQLVDIMRRLNRLDAYEPLLHFGWTQPMYPDEEPEARPLSSFVTPPEGLQGELSLYLSRYLHLAVKLQLDAPTDAVAENTLSPADINTDYGYSSEIVSYPVRYRIDEDRIFRNGDLRYFDHPKFGVLAKITRFEEEETPVDGEMLGSGELLGDGVQ